MFPILLVNTSPPFSRTAATLFIFYFSPPLFVLLSSVGLYSLLCSSQNSDHRKPPARFLMDVFLSVKGALKTFLSFSASCFWYLPAFPSWANRHRGFAIFAVWHESHLDSQGYNFKQGVGSGWLRPPYEKRYKGWIKQPHLQLFFKMCRKG